MSIEVGNKRLGLLATIWSWMHHDNIHEFLRLCCWALVNIAAVPDESCRCMDSSMSEFPVASDSEQPAASCFWARGVPYANLLPWSPTSQITLITLSLDVWVYEYMNSEALILLGQSSGYNEKFQRAQTEALVVWLTDHWDVHSISTVPGEGTRSLWQLN